MKNSKLKPCPFCGGEAKFVKDNQGGIYAECTSEHCGCSLDYASRDNETMRTHIIEQWNTRAERTCRPNPIYDRIFECDVCGEMDTDGIPDYCPGCGARVINE